MTGYPCSCCGFLTLAEKPPGTFAICPVCYWEDDAVQFAHPDSRVGANSISLRQARENYRKFGACSQEYTSNVRKPFPNEVPPLRLND